MTARPITICFARVLFERSAVVASLAHGTRAAERVRVVFINSSVLLELSCSVAREKRLGAASVLPMGCYVGGVIRGANTLYRKTGERLLSGLSGFSPNFQKLKSKRGTIWKNRHKESTATWALLPKMHVRCWLPRPTSPEKRSAKRANVSRQRWKMARPFTAAFATRRSKKPGLWTRRYASILIKRWPSHSVSVCSLGFSSRDGALAMTTNDRSWNKPPLIWLKGRPIGRTKMLRAADRSFHRTPRPQSNRHRRKSF